MPAAVTSRAKWYLGNLSVITVTGCHGGMAIVITEFSSLQWADGRRARTARRTVPGVDGADERFRAGDFACA